MKRVLIVGSHGYLGRHVCKLLKPDYELIEVDAGFWGQLVPAESCLDASTPAFPAWAAHQKPDAVVYLAAIAHDPENRIPAGLHNRHTTNAPLALCRALPDIPFIFTSSLSVFDNGGDVYPACKRKAEEALFKMRNTVILRFGTLYGPGVAPEYYRAHLLLNRMVYTALKHRKVEVFNPNAVRPVYCVFLAAADVVNATVWHIAGSPCKVAENNFERCQTIQEYAEDVSDRLEVPLTVVAGSKDERNYGKDWDTRIRGSQRVDGLIDWTKDHLDEIRLDRVQVVR